MYLGPDAELSQRDADQPAHPPLQDGASTAQTGPSVRETLSIFMSPAAHNDRPGTPTLPAAFSELGLASQTAPDGHAMMPTSLVSTNGSDSPPASHNTAASNPILQHLPEVMGQSKILEDVQRARQSSQPTLQTTSIQQDVGSSKGCHFKHHESIVSLPDTAAQFPAPAAAAAVPAHAPALIPAPVMSEANARAVAAAHRTPAADIPEVQAATANRYCSFLGENKYSRDKDPIHDGLLLSSSDGLPTQSRHANTQSPGTPSVASHAALRHAGVSQGGGLENNHRDADTQREVFASSVPAAWQGLAAQCGQVMDELGMQSSWLEEVLLPWAESASCGGLDSQRHHVPLHGDSTVSVQ